MSSAQPSQNQDRLRSHFNGYDASAHAQRWDSLWSDGTFLPWDRGHANPALIDTLNQRTSPLLPPSRRKAPHDGPARALVPGCGKGYDVALFAAHGYDAYGLEVSEHAVKAAQDYLADPGDGPLEGEYKISDPSIDRGATKCVLGDFFDDAWLVQVDGGLGEGFDIIYDNTFLCALAPELRSKWASRVTELLAPTGVLICLEFPTHKPPSSGGPPYALPSLVHEELLKRPGDPISYDERGNVVKTDSEESEQALVKIAHWTPERTIKVGIVNGIVTDRVSVWKHKP